MQDDSFLLDVASEEVQLILDRVGEDHLGVSVELLLKLEQLALLNALVSSQLVDLMDLDAQI